MNTRRLAPIALAAAVVLGATGCSMISPQATQIEYAASDGINLNVGDLDVRNALIIADEDGEDGNLVVAIVNTTSDSQTLQLEIHTTGAPITESIRVPANSTVSLGTADTDPLLLEGIDTMPGATLEVAFSASGSGAVLGTVPVLDGELPQYSDLAP